MQVPDSKRCPDCSTLLPAASFSRDKTHLDGLSTWCRKCLSVRNISYRRQRAASLPPVLPAVKRCSGPCGRVLPLAAFVRQAAREDRHYYMCKQCHSVIRRRQDTRVVDSE